MGSNLFHTLEAEFCPRLDSSLLTVLLAEIEHDDEGNLRKPSAVEVATLRRGLQDIAAEAELSQQFDDIEVATYTDDTASTPSMCFGETTTSSSCSSATPLGFLQAALPHINTDQLDKALTDAQIAGDGEMDMWEVIANVLTAESIREMEERGLGDDDDEPPIELRAWETVTPVKVSKKKKKTATKTIAIADIRQQHHLRPQTLQRRHTVDPSPGPSSDAWSQLASLATHVASLVPFKEPQFFLSYFHSPTYGSPYTALCAALIVVRDSLRYTQDEHIPRYLELLNIVLPMYEHLDSEEQSRMVQEAELCIIVSQEQDDRALDLVTLLRELDTDHSLGYQDMGIYHVAPSSSAPRSAPVSKLPAHPPPIAPPPAAKARNGAPKAGPNKPSPYQWQSVHKRKGPDKAQHVVAQHVPTYSRDVNGIQVKSPTRASAQKGEADMYRRRVSESMRKRNEMLREATRSWQRGAKSRGGEVALFFAERARQFQEMARKDGLELARLKIDASRTDPYIVDLHGTTGAEAVYIVRDIVASLDVSSKPLTVITGRGSHSVNQISVLKPAVRKALTEDGYTVSSWDGGLHIRHS